MNQRWILPLVATFCVAFASLAAAAPDPPTLEQHQRKAETVAPRYPTVPGKTLCVCQTANNSGTTYVGYLNSYPLNEQGDITVNMVCVYPVYAPGFGTAFCSLFEVIR